MPINHEMSINLSIGQDFSDWFMRGDIDRRAAVINTRHIGEVCGVRARFREKMPRIQYMKGSDTYSVHHTRVNAMLCGCLGCVDRFRRS